MKMQVQMRSLGLGCIFVIFSVVYGASISASGKASHRVQRFITPYPVPTLPSLESMLGKNSAPVSCPISSGSRTMLPSDDQMLELLRAQGGIFNQNLMAADVATVRNFPNMMSLQQHYEDDNASAILNFDPTVDNEVTKQKLLEDLNKWSNLKAQIALNSSLIGQTSSPTISTTINHILHNREVNVTDSPHLGQRQSAILTSDLKATLEQINKNIDEMLRGTSVSTRDLMDLVRSVNISIHPRILQSLQTGDHSRREKRNADGTTSTLQYCRRKGNETIDGFVHMCGVCAVTTKLQQDKFPRYLNELVCDTSDRTCLTVQNTPHGVCKQNVVYLRMLRQRPGGCYMLIKDGRRVFVNAWEVYTQRVRAGCECFIDRRSVFSQYIGR